VLRYRACFTEAVVGHPLERCRVRRCHLLFYLEDASLQVGWGGWGSAQRPLGA
jgi:hypothetical protein